MAKTFDRWKRWVTNGHKIAWCTAKCVGLRASKGDTKKSDTQITTTLFGFAILFVFLLASIRHPPLKVRPWAVD